MSKSLAEMVKDLARRPVPERVPAYATVQNSVRDKAVELSEHEAAFDSLLRLAVKAKRPSEKK